MQAFIFLNLLIRIPKCPRLYMQAFIFLNWLIRIPKRPRLYIQAFIFLNLFIRIPKRPRLLHVAVPRLRPIVTSVLQRKHRFDSRWVHVGFSVDGLALEQVFLRELRFPLPWIIPSVSHTHILFVFYGRNITFALSVSHQQNTSHAHCCIILSPAYFGSNWTMFKGNEASKKYTCIDVVYVIFHIKCGVLWHSVLARFNNSQFKMFVYIVIILKD